MPQMRIGPLMARTMVEDGHNVKSSARASRFSSGRSSMALRTACGVSLNRRARHGAIRTEHAAIARKRFQALATSFAVIEELARVRRHGVCGPMSTLRANQGRFRDQIRLPIHPPEAMSVAQDSTGAPIRWKRAILPKISRRPRGGWDFRPRFAACHGLITVSVESHSV
jgi:hypothetical protein